MPPTEAAERRVDAQLEGMEDFPGHGLVRSGLLDLHANRVSVAGGLVLVAADRLRSLGIEVSRAAVRPDKDELWTLLERAHGDDAHARYNALLGRVLSFALTAEALRSGPGAS